MADPRIVGANRYRMPNINSTLVTVTTQNIPAFTPYGPPQVIQGECYNASILTGSAFVTMGPNGGEKWTVENPHIPATPAVPTLGFQFIPVNQVDGKVTFQRTSGGGTSLYYTHSGWYGSDFRINSHVDSVNYLPTSGGTNVWKSGLVFPIEYANCIALINYKQTAGYAFDVRPMGSSYNPSIKTVTKYGCRVVLLDSNAECECFAGTIDPAIQQVYIVGGFPKRTYDLMSTWYGGSGSSNAWAMLRGFPNPTHATQTSLMATFWNENYTNAKFGITQEDGTYKDYEWGGSSYDYAGCRYSASSSGGFSFTTFANPGIAYREGTSGTYGTHAYWLGYLQDLDSLDDCVADATLWSNNVTSISGMIDTKCNHYRANDFVFSATEKSIYSPTASNLNTLFKIGDTFRVHNSVSNNGVFTVLNITNNKIYVRETVVTEP